MKIKLRYIFAILGSLLPLTIFIGNEIIYALNLPVIIILHIISEAIPLKYARRYLDLFPDVYTMAINPYAILIQVILSAAIYFLLGYIIEKSVKFYRENEISNK